MYNFLEDCDFKEKYNSCNLCLEVVENRFLEHHILGPTCTSKYLHILFFIM